MFIFASLPLSLILPPDGATDVPVDARIAVSEGVDAVSIVVDGVELESTDARSPGLHAWQPTTDLPPHAQIDVFLTAGDTEQHVSFETGGHTAVAPEFLPDVDPWLQASFRPDGHWDVAVEAQQPDAEPFGLFRVVYALVDGNVQSVDAAWAARDDGPARGAWTSGRLETVGYCAGVAYVDVSGSAVGPVEVCTELIPPDQPLGCSTVPSTALGWLAVFFLPLFRRYPGR